MFPMPLSYATDALQDIVHTDAEGSIMVGDLRARIKTVNEDALFRPGMNVVADMPKAKILMSLQDAPALVRLFLQ